MIAVTQTVDVDAYFKRIGHGGGREPTLATLREIVRLHTQVIPFENLEPLAHQPVDLSPAGLQRKLIGQRRGGYCFEQNSLLKNVLLQLGYQVAGLAGRVVWNLPPGAPLPPRTHMVLRVELEGEPHIVDVGFGGMTLTGVLRLQPDIEQSTPHEPYRLVHVGDTYMLQASVHSQWRPMYQFDLQEQTSADYELMNWYTSAYPASRFRHHLVAARTTPDRRYSLFNKEFSIHRLGGPTEQKLIATVAEVRELLQEAFLLQAPLTPELDDALNRIFTEGTP